MVQLCIRDGRCSPPPLKTFRSGRHSERARSFKLAFFEKEARLLEMRITSDQIKLPGGRKGLYACTEYGLALVVDRSHRGFANGGKLVIELLTKPENLKRDKKSGAKEIVIM